METPAKNEYESIGMPSERPGMSEFAKRTLKAEAFYAGMLPYGEVPKDDDDAKKANEAKRVKKHPRYFVIRRIGPTDIFTGLRIWLNTTPDGNPAPFISPLPLSAWSYIDKKTKRRRTSTMYPPKTCPLARVLEEAPERVSARSFTDEKGEKKVDRWPSGQPKMQIDEVWAVEAYELNFVYEKDAAGVNKLKIDSKTGFPCYTINTKPFIIELREPWWEQVLNKVLVPKPPMPPSQEITCTPEDPSGEEAKAKLAEAMKEYDKILANPIPAVPKNWVVLKFMADYKEAPSSKRDPVEAKRLEADKKNVRYEISYAPKLTVDPATWTPDAEAVLPSKEDGTIDWGQVYTPTTAEEINRVIFTEHSEAATGQEKAAEPPAGPANEEDIPF
jgi:hypothetical protein